MAEKRREIDRHHKWSPGHNPRDDDAHEDSGWLYVTDVVPQSPPPEGPKIRGQSGPPAGMKCVVHATCREEMYVLQSYTPQEALAHIKGIGGDFVFPKQVEDRMLALACSAGHSCTWKESLLPARQRALGRQV